MKNKFQNVFRVAVCLVLVCCLTVNISPIKAKAAVDPATAIAFDFAARSVIASAMQGLGVSKGSDSTVFDGVVNRAVDALGTTTNFISDGFAKVARFNLNSGLTMFFMPIALLQTLWEWLLGEKIVSSSAPEFSFLTASSSFQYGAASTYTVTVYNPCYCFGAYVGTIAYFVLASPNAISYKKGSDSVTQMTNTTDGGFYYQQFRSVSSDKLASANIPFYTDAECDSYGGFKGMIDVFFGNASATTDYDLTLGVVGNSSQPVEEAHPTWAENAVSVPGSVYGSDDDYVPSVPIAVAPDYEGTTNMSQADVQAGNSTWVDTETDTDVGTDTEIGELSGTLAEADANTFLDKIGYFFECLLEGIRVLPDAIKKVLTDVFIPSQAFIQTKVETLLGEFPFIGDIISTGTYIRDSLTGASGPPVIYVDLSAADGDIDYGEKTLLTDFSWYAPYKGTVDSVLGAALWAFFGWRVFLRLPGLISGAEGYVGEFRTRYDSYSKKRKED